MNPPPPNQNYLAAPLLMTADMYVPTNRRPASLAAALVAASQLTERVSGLMPSDIAPARCLVSVGVWKEHHEVLVVAVVIRLVFGPGRVVGRHDPAAIGADELALGDDVGEAKPDFGAGSGRHGTLVLRLGAGHGQVSAELGAEALRLCVVGFLVQPGQTAAGTAAEAGRTAARIGHGAWKCRTSISESTHVRISK